MGNTITSISTVGEASAFGAAVATEQTEVTVNKSTVSTNVLNTFAMTTSALQGGAFSTNGGSLTVVNSTISKNSPARWRSFTFQNAKVTTRGLVLEGKKFPGTRSL